MSSSRERKSLENSPRTSLDNEKNDAFPSEYLEKENSDLQQDANDTPSETVNEDAKPFKGIRLLFIFLGLQIALFLAALDTTIVAPSLPHIGSEFNQMSIVSWVASAYILTFDVFQPLFAKFSDIFGRKWILIAGISVFLFGSILSGVSTSMIMLIVARAISGIGAAGIFSMVFIIISDIVPLEKRGSYQGIVNAVFALASVMGPLIGGSFTQYITWRWNFYINLPIGAVAMAILLVFLRLPSPKGKLNEKMKRIDYFGTATVFVFSTLFLLAMNFGGQMFPWKSAAVIVPLVLTVVLVIALFFIESRVAEPMMPPRLFKNRSIACNLAANWFFGMTFCSFIYFLPIYFQVVRGDTAMWSGIRLIPMQMIICVFSTLAGIFISKRGIYRPLLPIGMALVTLSTGLLSLFGKDTSWSTVYGFTIIGGAGFGFVFSSAIIALQASSEPKDIAVVTGLGNFVRILGEALGIAISSAVLNSSLSQDLPAIVPEDIASKIIDSSEYVRNGCPPEYVDDVLNVYLDAIRLIWYVMIGMSLIGFLFSLGLKSYPILKPKTHGSPTPSRAEDVATVTDISISNNTLNERRSSSIVVNVLPPKETITN